MRDRHDAAAELLDGAARHDGGRAHCGGGRGIRSGQRRNEDRPPRPGDAASGAAQPGPGPAGARQRRRYRGGEAAGPVPRLPRRRARAGCRVGPLLPRPGPQARGRARRAARGEPAAAGRGSGHVVHHAAVPAGREHLVGQDAGHRDPVAAAVPACQGPDHGAAGGRGPGRGRLAAQRPAARPGARPGRGHHRRPGHGIPVRAARPGDPDAAGPARAARRRGRRAAAGRHRLAGRRDHRHRQGVADGGHAAAGGRRAGAGRLPDQGPAPLLVHCGVRDRAGSLPPDHAVGGPRPGAPGLRPGRLPRAGAHRLRHSLATGVLRAGAPLSEVGQLLRHRSQLSTSVYAKIDYARLALVARPWPLPAGTEAGA